MHLQMAARETNSEIPKNVLGNLIESFDKYDWELYQLENDPTDHRFASLAIARRYFRDVHSQMKGSRSTSICVACNHELYSLWRFARSIVDGIRAIMIAYSCGPLFPLVLEICKQVSRAEEEILFSESCHRDSGIEVSVCSSVNNSARSSTHYPGPNYPTTRASSGYRSSVDMHDDHWGVASSKMVVPVPVPQILATEAGPYQHQSYHQAQISTVWSDRLGGHHPRQASPSSTADLDTLTWEFQTATPTRDDVGIGKNKTTTSFCTFQGCDVKSEGKFNRHRHESIHLNTGFKCRICKERGCDYMHHLFRYDEAYAHVRNVHRLPKDTEKEYLEEVLSEQIYRCVFPKEPGNSENCAMWFRPEERLARDKHMDWHMKQGCTPAHILLPFCGLQIEPRKTRQRKSRCTCNEETPGQIQNPSLAIAGQSNLSTPDAPYFNHFVTEIPFPAPYHAAPNDSTVPYWDVLELFTSDNNCHHMPTE